MDSRLLAHAVAGHGPPLLLLNGGLMSYAAWDPLVGPLAERLTVVRCDLRGQLLSPGPPPATIEAHASDVLRLLDSLRMDQAHVVGTSFGALVGIGLSVAHPRRVRSLVAIAATDRVTPPMWQVAEAVRTAAEVAAQGGDGGVVFDLVVPGTFSAEYRARCADQLAARRQAVAALPGEWFLGLAGLLGSLEGVDLGPVLERVACPTLVLAAEHDMTFPIAHARALARGISDARLRVVPGAAHAVALEQPDLVAAAILEFIGDITPPADVATVGRDRQSP
jgi:3-oxoadipate enol-lactonase